MSSNNITHTHMNDLPDKLVCSICEFLPKTSTLLFAVACTPLSNWCIEEAEPSTTSKAIVSSIGHTIPYKSLLEGIVRERLSQKERDGKRIYSRKWEKGIDELAIFEREVGKQIGDYYNGGIEILDFIDLPKDLASRLTDDDLAAVLLCIDAKNNLKRLNLTHCFSIIGHGLEPLRGSIVLEKLDLGLARHIEPPTAAYDEANMNQEVIVRFLRTGILSDRNNLFRRLQIPHTWCDGIGCDELTRVLERYRSTTLSPLAFCWYFGYRNEDEVLTLLNRGLMGEDLVNSCAYCYEQRFFICDHCDILQCKGCDIHGHGSCNDCGKRYCEHCHDGLSELSKVDSCSYYETCPPRCGWCLNQNCRNGTNDCNGCKAKVFNKILVENNNNQAKIDQLRRQIEELRLSNE